MKNVLEPVAHTGVNGEDRGVSVILSSGNGKPASSERAHPRGW